MDITPASLDAVFLNLNQQFQQGFTGTPVWNPRLSMLAPSTGRQNVYPWLGQLPYLKKFVGPRTIKALALKGYTLPNDDFEDTITIKRNDFADDQIGVFAPIAQGLGEASRKWPDIQLAAAITSNGLCFDGATFFSGAHPKDPNNGAAGTYANDYAGGYSLTAANYETVRAAMMGLRGEEGQPLGVMPSLLVVPPALERAGRQILQADMIPNDLGTASMSNTLKGTADLLVIPELAGADTTWYLLDCSKSCKPFLWQLREAPSLVSLTSPSDPNVFFQKEFIYGVTARGAAGYTLPFLAARASA